MEAMGTLQSSGRSKERVLIFGLEATGKSEAAKDVAARIYPNKLFVIDNDNAWDRMLEGPTIPGDDVQVEMEWRWDESRSHKDEDGNRQTGDWAVDDRWTSEGGNIWVFHADGGWLSNTHAIRTVREEAGPDDWCLIDSGSALWDDVQEFYTNSVFDKSMASYFLQVRLEIEKSKKDTSALGAFDGWTDWGVINPLYKQHVMRFLVTPPCHLMVTAEQAARDAKSDDKAAKQLYAALMVKPRGQKRMGHNVQTIIHLRKDRGGDYFATTVKDRGGREQLVNEEVTGRGFGDWYLEGVGGWQEATQAPEESPSTASPGPVAKKTIAKPKVVAKS